MDLSLVGLVSHQKGKFGHRHGGNQPSEDETAGLGLLRPRGSQQRQEGCFPQSFRENTALPTLVSDSWLQNCSRIDFCYLSLQFVALFNDIPASLSDSRDVWLSLVFDSEQTQQLGHLPQQVNPNLSEQVDVNSSLNQPRAAYSL